MFKEKNEYLIAVPFEFIRGEIPNEIKPGIIMAYCWCARFGTRDGFYHNSLNEISNEMGLHYNKAKDRHHPQRIKNFRDGLQYLIDNSYVFLIDGDLKNYDSVLKVQVNYDYDLSRYVLINFKHFDYIFTLNQRIDKNNLIYILAWILSWYEKITINGKETTLSICSYSSEKMAKQIGLSPLSVTRYLKLLSGTIDENYPLVKEKKITYLYQGQYVSVPAIYVENTPYANQMIAMRNNYYKRKIAQDNSALPNNFEEVDDDLI